MSATGEEILVPVPRHDTPLHDCETDGCKATPSSNSSRHRIAFPADGLHQTHISDEAKERARETQDAERPARANTEAHTKHVLAGYKIAIHGEPIRHEDNHEDGWRMAET